MPIINPWEFPDIPALHSETQVYTSRQKNSVAVKEYKYTLAALLAWILANLSIPGPTTITVNGTGSIIIPAGKLLTVMLITSAAAQNVTIIDSSDSDPVLDSELMAAGEEFPPLRVDIDTRSASKTLAITCDDSITITYYLQ